MLEQILQDIQNYTGDYTDIAAKKIRQAMELYSINTHEVDQGLYTYSQLFNMQYEYQYELGFAKSLCENAKDPNGFLQTFSFWEAYRGLIRNDIELLNSCSHHVSHQNIIFLGGGPLPLTAILLAKEHGKRITVIEKEREAVQLSQKIISMLGLQRYITVLHINAEDVQDYSKYDVVYLSSFLSYVPSAVEKVIANIKNSAHNIHIFARTVEGAKRILYKPFPAHLEKHLVLCKKLLPQKGSLNTLCLYSLKAKNEFH